MDVTVETLFLGIFVVALVYALLWLFSPGKSAEQQQGPSSSAPRIKTEFECHRRTSSKQSSRESLLRSKYSLTQTCPKITIAISTKAAESNHLTGIKESLEVLSSFAAVFLVVDVGAKGVDSDAFAIASRLCPNILPTHRILPHTSFIGKVAIVRQLSPHLHVEYDRKAHAAIAPHHPSYLVESRIGDDAKTSASSIGTLFLS